MCLKQLLSLTSKCHFFNRCKFEFLFGEGSGRCAAVNYIYIPLNCFQERSLNSNVHGNRFDRASRLDGLNAPPDRTVCCSSPFHWRLLYMFPRNALLQSLQLLSHKEVLAWPLTGLRLRLILQVHAYLSILFSITSNRSLC